MLYVYKYIHIVIISEFVYGRTMEVAYNFRKINYFMKMTPMFKV